MTPQQTESLNSGQNVNGKGAFRIGFAPMCLILVRAQPTAAGAGAGPAVAAGGGCFESGRRGIDRQGPVVDVPPAAWINLNSTRIPRFPGTES